VHKAPAGGDEVEDLPILRRPRRGGRLQPRRRRRLQSPPPPGGAEDAAVPDEDAQALSPGAQDRLGRADREDGFDQGLGQDGDRRQVHRRVARHDPHGGYVPIDPRGPQARRDRGWRLAEDHLDRRRGSGEEPGGSGGGPGRVRRDPRPRRLRPPGDRRQDGSDKIRPGKRHPLSGDLLWDAIGRRRVLLPRPGPCRRQLHRVRRDPPPGYHHPPRAGGGGGYGGDDAPRRLRGEAAGGVPRRGDLRQPQDSRAPPPPLRSEPRVHTQDRGEGDDLFGEEQKPDGDRRDPRPPLLLRHPVPPRDEVEARPPLAPVPGICKGDEGAGGEAGVRGEKSIGSAAVAGGAGNIFGSPREQHHSELVDPKTDWFM